ncbi:RibD family protein [Nocardia acidivorans]|uniref:RibD family protein n=1 Tax=Nocardia acidivorans TaxID=404580 RepID=UPI001FDF5B30|nr:dihydrofolate reductase family protein [Nocardia acidivorans]
MTPDRLLLSNDADFDRVDRVRAESDAILIGAETVRRDNPRLMLRSEERQKARAAQGKPTNLLKVTVTRSGNIDPAARMFHHHVEAGRPLVYTTVDGGKKIGDDLREVAEIVELADDELFWESLLDDLGNRGVGQLMIEGGTHIHTAILAADLADELHYVVAPLLVGQAGAPRFVNPASFPGGSRRRLGFIDAITLGDVVVLRYRPKSVSSEGTDQ